MNNTETLNTYQIRDLKKYEEDARRLRLIVDELNKLDLGEVTEFEMLPAADNIDYTPRNIYIRALIKEGTIEISCERNGYGNADRWEFRASRWPTYTDEQGNRQRIDPSSLWNPKESYPTTTAAQDRVSKAIARQIASKIIPEYIRIYQRCNERALGAEEHARKSQDARERLADACQDAREFRGRPQRTFYVRNLEGTETKRVEYRSEGDVQINLTTDEAIAVIEMLRSKYA